ncbi:hypothetical protein AFLA_000925 [Aspergillus flavus NRRL3357]|nr:hypothetical protein AFLA_000925 [Aspergillus flavus NRRL3357]
MFLPLEQHTPLSTTYDHPYDNPQLFVLLLVYSTVGQIERCLILPPLSSCDASNRTRENTGSGNQNLAFSNSTLTVLVIVNR